jgi:uncharacterized SAM-binding protein YcdF (DUF218 family)
MFWLKKAVTYVLMPLQFSLILVVTGLILLWFTRRTRTGRGLITAGVLLLLILSHKQVGLALLQPLESRYPAIPELAVGAALPADLAACRTIVVLGGGHADTPGLPAAQQLSASASSRLSEGVRLARILPDARLVLTGPGNSPGGETHAAVMARAATALGVSPDRLHLIDTPRDTEEEIAAVRTLLGDAPVAVVTSAWHLPRTMAYAQKAELKAVPCPADFSARANPEFRWNDWTCDLTGLERSTKGIYERLGLLWARLRGRI